MSSAPPRKPGSIVACSLAVEVGDEVLNLLPDQTDPTRDAILEGFAGVVPRFVALALDKHWPIDSDCFRAVTNGRRGTTEEGTAR